MSGRFALWCCLSFASGCASVAETEAPAVLTNANAAAYEELREIVSDALNRKDIVIADDALTRDSMLIIERRPARDATGQRLSGRDLEKPEVFQLVIWNDACTLVHRRTGERYSLMRAECERT